MSTEMPSASERLQQHIEELQERIDAYERRIEELENALRDITMYGMTVPAHLQALGKPSSLIATDSYLAAYYKCSAYDMIGIAARALKDG